MIYPTAPGSAMRIVLLAHAPTAAIRTAAFPADEPLTPVGLTQAADLRGRLPRVHEVRCADSARCRQTADALGLDTILDPQLAGLDHGSWAGCSLDAVGAADPAGLGAWLTDPDARPHGGETLAELLARIGAWLDSRADPPHAVLAVVDAAVARAAVVHALGAPATAMWRVDVAPLTSTLLVGEPGRWNLRSLQSSA